MENHIMRQYEFEAIHRTRGNVERIRATASRADYARAHIVSLYGDQFDVMESHCDTNPPHQITGEIDASTPEHDEFARLLLKANTVSHTSPAALSRLIESQLAAGAYPAALELAESVLAIPELDPAVNEAIRENLSRHNLTPTN